VQYKTKDVHSKQDMLDCMYAVTGLALVVVYQMTIVMVLST